MPTRLLPRPQIFSYTFSMFLSLPYATSCTLQELYTLRLDRINIYSFKSSLKPLCALTPITFQLYIYRALGGLVNRIYIIYLDNILIYLEDKDQHKQYIHKVLERLDSWGLYAKALKYIFNTKKVKFLGYIITPIGAVIDLVQVQII